VSWNISFNGYTVPLPFTINRPTVISVVLNDIVRGLNHVGYLTAKVREKVNRKCPLRNTYDGTIFTPPHTHTDPEWRYRLTERQYHANSGWLKICTKNISVV